MVLRDDPIHLPAEGPVLLGQRTLQPAVACEKSEYADVALTTPALEKGHARGCLQWFSLVRWFEMLYATFGLFVPLAMLCYGLQQGFKRQVEKFASKYYMMDTLKLDGVTIGRLQTASHLPWNIKPVLGMLSDGFPLFGFHRTSYLVIMCSVSVLLHPPIVFTAVSAMGLLAFLTCSNLTAGFSDLVVDATAARLARTLPTQACDLQTAIRTAEATGGMLSSAMKGVMVSHLSPLGAIFSSGLCAVAVLVPALRGWLPEERLPKGHRCTPDLKSFKQNSGATLAAGCLATLAVTLSLTQTFLSDWRSRAGVLTICAFAALICVHKVFRKISSYLWTTAALLFLRGIFSPGLGESMFVWMSKDPAGPLFSPELLGLADCLGDAGFVISMFIFNRYLRKWKYRNIFLLGQLLGAFAQMMDLILVLRWNRVIGLPDILFFLGDETFEQTMEKTFYVPVVMLAYKVCPANLEATIFATLIATSNIGRDCGKYWGVILAEMWGIVGGNFEHLPHGIISKTLVRLLSIPLILMLSPDMTPDDPIPMEKDDEDDKTCEGINQPEKSSSTA